MKRIENWEKKRMKMEEKLVMEGEYKVIKEKVEERKKKEWMGDEMFKKK